MKQLPEINDSSSSTTMTSSHRSKLRLEDLEVRPTELGFVTQVDEPSSTFFIQFCRFTLDELVAFNKRLTEYCDEQHKLKAAEHDGNAAGNGSSDDDAGRSRRERKTHKIHRGDIICVRFSEKDSNWYRALVLKRDESLGQFHLLYLDYGDIQTTNTRYIVVPDPDKFPLIKRCKFGITCSLEGSENIDQQQSAKLLAALKNKYIMVKIVAKQTKLQYLVSIPRNAYNLPFWIEYEPDNYDHKSSSDASKSDAKKMKN